MSTEHWARIHCLLEKRKLFGGLIYNAAMDAELDLVKIAERHESVKELPEYKHSLDELKCIRVYLEEWK